MITLAPAFIQISCIPGMTCSFIENFALQLKLTNLDLNSTSLALQKILCTYPPDAVTMRLKVGENFPDISKQLAGRISNCDRLLLSCLGLSVDEILKIILDAFPGKGNNKDKAHKPYLGKKEPFLLPSHIELRQGFWHNIKGIIEKILNINNISTYPSVEDIRKFFDFPEICEDSWNIKDFCVQSDVPLTLSPIIEIKGLLNACSISNIANTAKIWEFHLNGTISVYKPPHFIK